MTQQSQEEFKIEAYNLADYSKLLYEGFKQGFELDLESNNRYPWHSGAFMYAVLVKNPKGTQASPKAQESVVEASSPLPEPSVEVAEVKKPGRPAKSK